MNEPIETEMQQERAISPRKEEHFSPSGFELAQRMATALSKSNLIPENFRNNVPNCLIALEMAHRMNASPMMVMQNLYIVHGKPAWSSQFIIAALNSTGRFSPLRFDLKGEKMSRTCVAWAKELATGERLEGPEVSMEMAKAEGWFGKNGSKWQTMPELMLRYRSATFFGRLYAPEILMGMKEESEVIDISATVVEKPPIKFGPSGVEPNADRLANGPATIVMPSVTHGPSEPKPKRHRRTKAQIAADEAAKQHSAESESGEAEAKADGSAATEKPALATPLQGLQNLIASSPITPEQFRTHLAVTDRIAPGLQLETLPDDKIRELQHNFMVIADEILEPKPFA